MFLQNFASGPAIKRNKDDVRVLYIYAYTETQMYQTNKLCLMSQIIWVLPLMADFCDASNHHLRANPIHLSYTVFKGPDISYHVTQNKGYSLRRTLYNNINNDNKNYLMLMHLYLFGYSK